MSLAVISIMLALSASDPPPAAQSQQDSAGSIFTSAKTLATLQGCLTDRLAEIGEVVALKTEDNVTTLLVRDNPDGPMTIDLTPPKVIVTSRFITGSQKLIKDCL